MTTMTIDDLYVNRRGTAQRRSAPTLRLTRRGRLVVFTFALLAAFALGLVVAAGSVATEKPGHAEPTTVVTVAPGETLWGIAAELAENGEVEEMMARIERLNALDSAALESGQKLRVPAS